MTRVVIEFKQGHVDRLTMVLWKAHEKDPVTDLERVSFVNRVELTKRLDLVAIGVHRLDKHGGLVSVEAREPPLLVNDRQFLQADFSARAEFETSARAPWTPGPFAWVGKTACSDQHR